MIRVKMTKFVGVIISFVMALSCFSFVEHNSVSATNTNMQYRRYDCGTGAITSYTLSSVPYNNNTRDISVPENRVPDPGNTAVVYLRGIGTGFIVDDHVIATAAHCVSNWQANTFTSGLHIDICLNNANQVLATVMPSSIHVPSNYFTYSDEKIRSCYDYALIYVEADLSEYGIFNIGVPMDEFLDGHADVTGTGFPGTTNGNVENSNMTRYKSDGYIQFFENDYAPSRVLRFSASCCSSAGDSGGPLYTTTLSYDGEAYITVIGIVTGGLNNGNVYKGTSGVRMTTDLLHFYLNNSYL